MRHSGHPPFTWELFFDTALVHVVYGLTLAGPLPGDVGPASWALLYSSGLSHPGTPLGRAPCGSPGGGWAPGIPFFLSAAKMLDCLPLAPVWRSIWLVLF